MFTLSVTPKLESPCHRSMDEPPEQEVQGTKSCTHDELVVNRNSTTPDEVTQQLTTLALLNTELLDPDCEAVLEQLESCVGCVEGVDEQHAYEQKMIEHARHRKVAVEQHGLSEAEAAMIRLHIMEEEARDDSNKKVVEDSVIPDMDVLNFANFCGHDEDLDDAQENFVIATTHEVMSCADMIDEDLLVPRKDTAVRDGIMVGKDINALQCAICFDEALVGGSVSLNRVKFANLPCCGARQEGSTGSFIKVCTSCILVLTSPMKGGSHRIGRCPRCLTWIKVKVPSEKADKNVVTVEKVNVSGQCLICNQEKEFLVENDQVCDSCFLGRRQPLRYECQHCHGVQKIPHPMYRYQKTKDQFGNATWACQGQCGRFTKWKILPGELDRIPLGDAPKSWGADYIALARKRVKILREDIVGDKGMPTEEDPSQCQIL